MARQLVILLLLITLIPLSQSRPASVTEFRIIRAINDKAALINSGIEFAEEFDSFPADLVEVPRTFVESAETVLIDIGYPGGVEEDLVSAETHLFRPLFVYRQNISQRQKLKKVQANEKYNNLL